VKIKIKTSPCPTCQKVSEFEVEEDDLRDYMNRKGDKRLVQVAFPYLTTAEREQIMTGFDDECWKKLWAEPTELEKS
jgi:hypothetical protein